MNKTKVSVGKHFRKKNMGPGIVMVQISWSEHPGYQNKLDMGINRGALKTTRLRKQKTKKNISGKRKKNIKKYNGKKMFWGKKHNKKKMKK